MAEMGSSISEPQSYLYHQLRRLFFLKNGGNQLLVGMEDLAAKT